ncbi:flagellar hook-length control protein FliK [Ensifer aridi]|uniref:flagellar hook-length control protein FliK n=1 Tax=Ensifer aridi TaxID=1708715 RepID=UPI0004114D8D|nr:flagellar hook-length control protein FliK [Ensifer aridi]
MRPLDQSLGAAAAASTGRPGARQGRGQAEAEPGAFGEAVADAGRQKAQGQVTGQAANGSQIPADDVASGGRGPNLSIASNGREESFPGSVAVDAPPESEALPSAASNAGREATAKPVRRSPGMASAQASSGGERSVGVEEKAAPTEEATGSSRRDMRAVSGVAEEPVGAETPDGSGGTAEMETASGTVSDLLTMLGGAAPVSVGLPPENGAELPSKSHAAAGVSEKTADGILAGAADGGQSQAGEPTLDGGSDQLFRFARADGKGQAVSMSISQDGERVAVENSKSSAGAKGETVTVLEARRYLGLAMNANATSVTNAIADDGEWAAALQSGATAAQPEAWSQAGKTLNTLKIQMHPIELGVVTATLRLKDDELQVDLKVETGEAFRQLQDDQGEMVKALRAQGFAVDQVNVVFNAGGDASSGNGSQPQAQTQFGGQGRERAGDDGGERRQRQDGGQAAMERWTGNDAMDDAPNGAERPRTGHVYM